MYLYCEVLPIALLAHNNKNMLEIEKGLCVWAGLNTHNTYHITSKWLQVRLGYKLRQRHNKSKISIHGH